MKKVFSILIMLIVSVCLGSFIAQATTYWQAMDTDVDGTNEFSVDTDGDVVLTGYITVGSVTSASLPTSGYGAGTILFNSTNKMLYFATTTVTGVSSWTAIQRAD